MNLTEFYPTPMPLIRKMIDHIDFRTIGTALEPSAGKGDIAEVIHQRMKDAQGHRRYGYNQEEKQYDIDTIEIEENLRHILRGKGLRVVHDDFLTYETHKQYDLIVMNPPFSAGDKHLMKAIGMINAGGQIVCILNAETLRNRHSNLRKILQNHLKLTGAEVIFLEDTFTEAERKTDVEIALVKITVPEREEESLILDQLDQAQAGTTSTMEEGHHVIDKDPMQAIITRYKYEAAAGTKLINEYFAMLPYMLKSMKDEFNSPILSLQVNEYGNHKEGNKKETINRYMTNLRYKYWEALFKTDTFVNLLTSNMRDEFNSKINQLAHLEFSMFNIMEVKNQITQQMTKSVEETILSLFDELSCKHHYDHYSQNIHLYNGWRTNKAYKINKKVIIPLSARDIWGSTMQPTKATAKLMDIEKVFNYLDAGRTDHHDLRTALEEAEKKSKSKKIELKYFTVTFYKKGTTHIEFKDLELLKKFNLFGSQRKGWLPPNYGKATYSQMTPEEKKTVEEFEGQKEYNKTLKNKDYYLVQKSDLLQIAASN